MHTWSCRVLSFLVLNKNSTPALQIVLPHHYQWFLWQTFCRSSFDLMWLTLNYALSLPAENRPCSTYLYLVLSCAAASIFIQLLLKLIVHISFFTSLLQVFVGCALPLVPCNVHGYAAFFSQFVSKLQFCFLCLSCSSMRFWSFLYLTLNSSWIRQRDENNISSSFMCD